MPSEQLGTGFAKCAGTKSLRPLAPSILKSKRPASSWPGVGKMNVADPTSTADTRDASNGSALNGDPVVAKITPDQPERSPSSSGKLNEPRCRTNQRGDPSKS